MYSGVQKHWDFAILTASRSRLGFEAMASLQITSQIDLDQLIEGLAQLETSELETCIEKVSLLLAQRKAPHLSAEETRLLRQINRTLPHEVESRHSALQEKVYEETITPAEQEELMALIPVIEQADLERLRALISLSQIRQVTLPELMQQLGIEAPPVHA